MGKVNRSKLSSKSSLSTRTECKPGRKDEWRKRAYSPSQSSRSRLKEVDIENRYRSSHSDVLIRGEPKTKRGDYLRERNNSPSHSYSRTYLQSSRSRSTEINRDSSKSYVRTSTESKPVRIDESRNRAHSPYSSRFYSRSSESYLKNKADSKPTGIDELRKRVHSHYSSGSHSRSLKSLSRSESSILHNSTEKYCGSSESYSAVRTEAKNRIRHKFEESAYSPHSSSGFYSRSRDSSQSASLSPVMHHSAREDYESSESGLRIRADFKHRGREELKKRVYCPYSRSSELHSVIRTYSKPRRTDELKKRMHSPSQSYSRSSKLSCTVSPVLYNPTGEYCKPNVKMIESELNNENYGKKRKICKKCNEVSKVKKSMKNISGNCELQSDNSENYRLVEKRGYELKNITDNKSIENVRKSESGISEEKSDKKENLKNKPQDEDLIENPDAENDILILCISEDEVAEILSGHKQI